MKGCASSGGEAGGGGTRKSSRRESERKRDGAPGDGEDAGATDEAADLKGGHQLKVKVLKKPAAELSWAQVAAEILRSINTKEMKVLAKFWKIPQDENFQLFGVALTNAVLDH